MQRQRQKSKEEIEKINLAKTMGQIKKVVADRECLWLEYFDMMVEIILNPDFTASVGGMTVSMSTEIRIEYAGELADKCLSVYEKRWGRLPDRLQ